jgi:hypothetical protein
VCLLNNEFCSLSGWLTRSFVAGVRVRASGGSATATRLDSGSGSDIIVPPSVFFPSLAARLDVKRIGPRAFENTRIISSQFLVNFSFVIHHVFGLAIHFHRFHSKWNPRWRALKMTLSI